MWLSDFTNEILTCSCTYNIGFINEQGEEDETQFDAVDYNDLEEAWHEFLSYSPEIEEDSILYVERVDDTILYLDKEKFLSTEIGGELQSCIIAWDKWLEIGDRKAACWCQAQWEVYKMALRQYYGIEYFFTRTVEYFGVCTWDETDWLFKVERELK